jgi:hypothetical protein
MSNKIILKNVRLSFPSLFKKAVFDGKEGKYEATALLSKEEHKAVIAKIESIIDAECKEAKIKRPTPDKLCLKDGDTIDYAGYENCFSLKASNNKRPTVINRDKSPIVEEDDVLYAGCYVNMVVDFWVQNNGFGKRVNANLLGIQFVKDGEAFGAGSDSNVSDDFDEIDDDEF